MTIILIVLIVMILDPGNRSGTMRTVAIGVGRGTIRARPLHSVPRMGTGVAHGNASLWDASVRRWTSCLTEGMTSPATSRGTVRHREEVPWQTRSAALA